MSKKPTPWWASHYYGWVELTVLVVIAAALIYAWRAQSGDKIGWVLTGNRSAVYALIGSISGALLGFVITALSIVLTIGADRRIAILQKSGQLRAIYHIFTGAIAPFAAATIVSVVAVLVDRDASQTRPAHVETPVAIICALAAVWAALRLWRSIRALVDLIDIIVTRSEQAESDKAGTTGA